MLKWTLCLKGMQAQQPFGPECCKRIIDEHLNHDKQNRRLSSSMHASQKCKNVEYCTKCNPCAVQTANCSTVRYIEIERNRDRFLKQKHWVMFTNSVQQVLNTRKYPIWGNDHNYLNIIHMQHSHNPVYLHNYMYYIHKILN